jgi:predicted DNA-binding WGR domain protein
MELVNSEHDKFYRMFNVRSGRGDRAVMQWGRRGAQGQFAARKTRFAQSFLYEQERAKHNKGYRSVGEAAFELDDALLGDFAGMAVGNDLKAALHGGFSEAWREQFSDMLALVAQDGGNRSVMLISPWAVADGGVWGWLGELLTTLADRSVRCESGGVLALVESTAARRLAAMGRPLRGKFELVGPALGGDDAVTLEVMAGIWTPGEWRGELRTPLAALEAARLLVSA